MKGIVRGAAALNAFFQLGVGLVAVFAPAAAAGLFKVAVVSTPMLALIRMLGGLLASSGVISGLVAADPDRSPALCRAFAACLLMNAGTDAIAIAAGEMTFGQLAIGMALEFVLAVLLLVRTLPAKPSLG